MKTLRVTGPLIFALFSFGFYMLLYNPSIDSEGFVTAVMVFFAALGGAAVALFTTGKHNALLYLHIAVSMLAPILMGFLLENFSRPWGWWIIGIQAFCIVFGYFFGTAHYRQEARKEAEAVNA